MLEKTKTYAIVISISEGYDPLLIYSKKKSIKVKSTINLVDESASGKWNEDMFFIFLEIDGRMEGERELDFELRLPGTVAYRQFEYMFPNKGGESFIQGASGRYEALTKTLHMKAVFVGEPGLQNHFCHFGSACGIIVINDFGRQKNPSLELTNQIRNLTWKVRWNKLGWAPASPGSTLIVPDDTIVLPDDQDVA